MTEMAVELVSFEIEPESEDEMLTAHAGAVASIRAECPGLIEARLFRSEQAGAWIDVWFWSSSRRRDSRYGRPSSADASGTLRLPPPASTHSASTISGTPPSRSGSPREPIPNTCAAMAGHTSVSVVLDRYGHLYPQQDDELMRRLASRAGVPHVGLGG
jgi:heme-degrading monooxygenase HmoA